MKPTTDALDTSQRSLTLKAAWRRFSVYDRSATAAQRRFILMRQSILVLSVAATTLAVLQSKLKPLQDCQTLSVLQVNLPCGDWLKWVSGTLWCLVILAPIVTSTLLAGAVKFDRGINYILLRASAEAVKREIFRYRARTTLYKDPAVRDAHLAREIQTIGERLMKTQVNQASLMPYEDVKPDPNNKDDKFSELNAQNYLNWRLIDQLTWYRKKTRVLDTQWQRFQWLIYVLGGIGTFLAAISQEIWIAVSNALVGAFASFLELKQMDSTLIAYNQAANNLENILCWWYALSPDAQQQPENFEKLVENTETVIQAEGNSWVQEMRDALAGLYSDKDENRREEPAPDDAAPPPEEASKALSHSTSTKAGTKGDTAG
ncbi:DUF4231 domain-containing protein [Leptolyngbya sp. FACHB-261]|uniref:DUF4231 domain-containing protein n=1 Tax=Leptolyngbya sp. FACHB-261 TaxID=2692806 RepID=UPI001681D039|nr:DUF4231 domain-containing protein [Leptolyngbya sp. FACHB-261]MBD2101732.1 DUF4231 domain-containing protein [Leptolyngbya sp. FACHB-261]